MIRVSAGLGRDIPRLVPAKIILIHQDTHQLCDRHRRVGVIELEHRFLIKFPDIRVILHIL